MDQLVEDIYEAALVPEYWPRVLDELSALSDSAGGAVLALGPGAPPRWVASDVVAPRLRAYVESNEWHVCARPKHFLDGARSGFARDVDLFTADELAGRTSLRGVAGPGLGYQIGTTLPMPAGDVVVFSCERHHADGPHDPAVLTRVNPLRPHLARAGLLASRIGLERATSAIATLKAVGLPAAVLTQAGRVLVTNDLMDGASRIAFPTSHGGLALHDPVASAQLREVIEAGLRNGEPVSRSLPIRAGQDRPPAVLHLMPLAGAAHDIFTGAALIAVLTVVEVAALPPDGALLLGLFDLTPAEARVATGLTTGSSLAQIADDQGVGVSTIRTHLERLFRKTGTHQQSQLVALLKTVGPAHGSPAS